MQYMLIEPGVLIFRHLILWCSKHCILANKADLNSLQCYFVSFALHCFLSVAYIDWINIEIHWLLSVETSKFT
jgi:hypothetical protein